MNKVIIFCIFLALIFIIIAYFQIQNKEHFDSEINSNDKNILYIKKTNDFKKVYSNKKYTIWIPNVIDDYFPTGTYLTKKNELPKQLATLVKNEYGDKSNDKPNKYEIVSITNNNYAFWKPLPHNKYKSLGFVCSKEYPSKFLIRTVPEKFLKKTNISNKIIENKLDKSDKGYELWNIKYSNHYTINNLNNLDDNENLKNTFKINEDMCSVEKKLYVKYITSYKKLITYNDPKTNNIFNIWIPLPPKNFCNIGYVCLKNNINPNNKLKCLVVHKSCCKPPLNYGEKEISSIHDKEKHIVSFWKPFTQKLLLVEMYQHLIKMNISTI